MTLFRNQAAAALLLGVLVTAAAVGAGCRKTEDRGGDGAVQEGLAQQSSQTPYYPGVIEEYRTILAEDPHNMAAVIALGNAHFDAGQWREAVGAYEQALRLDPHNADVITDLGTCYRNLGDFNRAIREYERALRLEPVHLNAMFNLGVVYGHDKKDYARAVAYWEQLLHAAPKHPRAEYLQASIARYKQAMKKGQVR
jgi:cytochrome c-type biogenesis protein CcmH/NrfG